MSTAAELITIAREDHLDDAAGSSSDYNWSDAELLRRLNRGYKEACLRMPKLIYDESTAAVCNITLSTDTASYDLDTRILEIDEDTVRLDSNDKYLTFETEEGLKESGTSWRANDSGEPASFIIKGTSLIVSPPPSSDYNADVIKFGCYRLPISDLRNDDDWSAGSHSVGDYVAPGDGYYYKCTVSGTDTVEPTWDTTVGSTTTSEGLSWVNQGIYYDTPEFHSSMHEYLVYWMCHEAYNKRDEDTFNPAKATYYLKLFEQHFGPPRTVVNILTKRRAPRSLKIVPPGYF